MNADTGSSVARPLLTRALAEFAGTALLVFLGVSALLVIGCVAGPLQNVRPGGWLPLSVLLGLAFGYAVTFVINSPLGRVSGQYNPSISLMLWIAGRQSAPTTLVYLVAQLSGGILGAALLLVWGRRGAELQYGATTPLPEVPLWAPILSELVSTTAIAFAIIAIIEGRVTGHWAFHLVPVLFGALAPVAAPLSGLSINAARTLGPAIVTGQYDHLWLYFVVPPLGALFALLVSRTRRQSPADR